MWGQVLSRIALISTGILIISFWLPILLWLFLIFVSVFSIMMIIALFTGKTNIRVVKIKSRSRPTTSRSSARPKVIDITQDQEKK